MGSVNPKPLISRVPLGRCRSPSAKEKAPFGPVCVCVCVCVVRGAVLGWLPERDDL